MDRSRLVHVLAALALAGCGSSSTSSEGASAVSTGGGSAGGSDLGGFHLSSISVAPDQVLEINRPLEFVFTDAVLFSTVSLNTISVRDDQGVPANGVFSFDPAQPRVVRFQPTCPVKSDFSDAGFLAGGRRYTIQVLGEDGGLGIAVASTKGALLKTSQSRSFYTPSSTELGTLFADTVPGAPLPVVRALGSGSPNATYVEVGQDSSIARRIYFERDPATQLVSRPGTGDGSIPEGHPLEAFETGMPLNLFSNAASRLAFVVELNQPVNPSPENVNAQRIRVEAETSSGSGTFQALPATVELVQNCTTTGATLRVTPRGVLPQDRLLRLVISEEFEDLSGVRPMAAIDDFAVIRTRLAGSALADEVLEEFLLGAPAAQSLEDPTFATSSPLAVWRNGVLAPRFDFQGTGGPNNAFDFIVRATQGTVTIDTNFATVTDANQTLQQTIVNGRMDVRNFTIEQGATLRLLGSNPMTINATGLITINGTVDLSAFGGKDVAGIATATFPEPGAAGNLGGGKGGDASQNTSQSTPRGQTGNGPFGVPGLGGQGGESGFGLGGNGNPNLRKGAGGGGGVLGRDPVYGVTMPANLVGTQAQEGGKGNGKATGAVTGGQPQGGGVGTSPFRDGDSANDFFGTMFVPATMTAPQRVVSGELQRVWAGAGGGGAGDSIRSATFPNPSFDNTTDDKGGAAGGGSGGIHLRALGDIRFGSTGRILAQGGGGAKGQYIAFMGNAFTRAGASGGGGSGGHVVLESSSRIDLGTGVDVISARGGPGGDGAAVGAGDAVARGGDGGPGIVQLHTPDGFADIVSTQDLALACVPPPVGFDPSTGPGAGYLLPNFGAVSRARSTWIPLGGAVGSSPDDVTFLFEGTDPMTGLVQASAGVVNDLAPLIGPAPLTVGASPRIVDAHTLVLDSAAAGTTFATDDLIYRDNPVLMKNFVIVLRDIASPLTQRRYNVALAARDAAAPDLLVLTTASTTLPFDEFTGAAFSQIPNVANVELLLLPRFLRVVTGGVGDILPTNAAITVRFSGAAADSAGNPDTAALLVPSTADVADLFDAALPQPVDFFRFEVEFNLDVGSLGLSATAARPVLDFLRVPFRF